MFSQLLTIKVDCWKQKWPALIGQNSEIRQEGNLKFLYKLKVDESALRKRNVNPKPTEYRKRTMAEEQVQTGKALQFKDIIPPPDTAKKEDAFETEFDKDTTNNPWGIYNNVPNSESESVLKTSQVV